jgi:glycerol uptake facilitator-like aquaporin
MRLRKPSAQSQALVLRMPCSTSRSTRGRSMSAPAGHSCLLGVIWGCVRRRPEATPFAVGAYITAAYWFTASTSFANPAVTLARSVTGTFAGIRPDDVPGFIGAQLLGAATATLLFRWLVPAQSSVADRALIDREKLQV